jgi:hypothetical protein
MKRTKRTIIRTETQEILIIHQLPKIAYEGWCGECRKRVYWLSLVQTANCSGFRSREVFRLIEAGEIHLQEMMEGDPFICSNSPAIINRHGKDNLVSIKQLLKGEEK